MFPISPLKQEVFRVALPHLALISLSLFYVVTGAYLFRSVEPAPPSINSSLSAVQSDFLDDLWNDSKIFNDFEFFQNFSIRRFDFYFDKVFDKFQSNKNHFYAEWANDESLLPFLFFTVSTLTSIGKIFYFSKKISKIFQNF